MRNLAGRSSGVGIRKGTPDAFTCCFARAMRWAIVASPTRNAFAISAVVSPPTARSVSAIAEAGVSAGWQHMKSTIKVSSRSETSGAGGSCDATLSRLLPRLLAPPLVDQPALGGLQQPAAWALGNPVPRPVLSGSEERLLNGVLGGVEVAVPANERPEDLRRRLAQQVLDTDGRVQLSPPTCSRNASISAASDGASVIIWRRWIGCWVAIPSGPGTAESFPAISIARSSDSTSMIW